MADCQAVDEAERHYSWSRFQTVVAEFAQEQENPPQAPFGAE